MPRGKKSKVGDTRVAPNGYHYTRTTTGWELTHRLVAEKELGRALTPEERVRFIDGDRSNRDPDNLEVYEIKQASKEKKKARIEARIEELQAQLQELELEQ